MINFSLSPGDFFDRACIAEIKQKKGLTVNLGAFDSVKAEFFKLNKLRRPVGFSQNTELQQFVTEHLDPLSDINLKLWELEELARTQISTYDSLESKVVPFACEIIDTVKEIQQLNKDRSVCKQKIDQYFGCYGNDPKNYGKDGYKL